MTLAWLWIVVAVVVAIWVWPRIWRNSVRNQVQCYVDFQRHECDIGEPVSFFVICVNQSWMPIPHMQVLLELPEELSVDPKTSNRKLIFTTYIWGKRRVRLDFTVYGFARGPGVIRDLYLTMHEGLGVNHVHISLESLATVAVHPEPLRLLKRQRAMTIMGEQLRSSRLFPDETLVRGVQPYQPGDSARHIHWRASARLGMIVSKQFYSTTDRSYLIIFNTQTHHPHWVGTAREPFERGCSAVLDAAAQLIAPGSQIRFITNAVIRGQRHADLPKEMSIHTLKSALAHAQAYTAVPLTRILHAVLHHHRQLPECILLFSAFETDEQQLLLKRLQRLGKQIEIISTNASEKMEEAR